MTRLLIEIGSFNYYTATQPQFEVWIKRHDYTLLGPSEVRPQVTLWTSPGKPLLRARELRPLSSTTPETPNA